MPLERINLPLSPDAGEYSHHVVKDGNTVYLSGQVGYDKDHELSGDAAAQIEQTFKNVQSALTSVGSDMRHIIKMIVCMTSKSFPEDLPTVLAIRAKYIPDESAPAGTLLLFASLGDPDISFQLDIIASIP
jgi:2-iminobutanoate/2-iminopropanoate deaminase